MNWRVTLIVAFMALCMTAATDESPGFKERLASIIIPSIEFRQANAFDVLHFLVDASTAGDPEAVFSPSIGLTITNKQVTTSQYIYVLDDGSPIDLPQLTIQYHHISVLEAIDRVTTELGFTYLLEDERIVFQTKDGKTMNRRKIVER